MTQPYIENDKYILLINRMNVIFYELLFYICTTVDINSLVKLEPNYFWNSSYWLYKLTTIIFRNSWSITFIVLFENSMPLGNYKVY